jgi:6-phosphogluconate dehydrogenase
MKQADIGLIGLAVMAKISSQHGKTWLHMAVFNRTVSKVDDFINGRANGKKIIGTHSIKECVSVLQKPRRVMLMVRRLGSKMIYRAADPPSRPGRYHH